MSNRSYSETSGDISRIRTVIYGILGRCTHASTTAECKSLETAAIALDALEKILWADGQDCNHNDTAEDAIEDILIRWKGLI